MIKKRKKDGGEIERRWWERGREGVIKASEEKLRNSKG